MGFEGRGGVEERTAPLPEVRGSTRTQWWWVVGVAALVAVLGRLPFFGDAPGADEAGFLIVGAQWDGAGSSLYTDHWVDRPPLLIVIFRVAALLGGLSAVRLIGCLAVALTIVGVAVAARHIVGTEVAGNAAGRWAAVCAAAWFLSPLLGSHEVNGELLAAPFIAWGIVAVALAVRVRHRRRAVAWAAVAGALAVCALLIKQNFADVAVFGAIAFSVAWLLGDITRRRFLALSAAATGGALAAAGVVAAYTAFQGTSLIGVFEAMYPFRLRAARAIADGGSQYAMDRLGGLISAAMVSGLVVVVVLLGLDVLIRRRRSALSWALAGLTAFAVLSVASGGAYWLHYLLELVVPLSLAAGLLIAQRRWLIRPVVAYILVAAAVAWTLSLSLPRGSSDQSAGAAIAAVSVPGDSIVSLYGRADVVLASGLTSPYEHLWSLPVRVKDPNLRGLDTVLTSRRAPTWIVVAGSSIRSWGLNTTRTEAIIARDYRSVATVCGRTIYQRQGLRRPVPRAPASCSAARPTPTALNLKEPRP